MADKPLFETPDYTKNALGDVVFVQSKPVPVPGNGIPEMDWEMSNPCGELFAALALAQGAFDPVLKDSENPAYKSKYADLSNVIEATRPHLASNKLAIIQMPSARFSESDAKEMRLVTLMGHSSGQWVRSTLTLPAMMRERFDSQSVGSAITYARRYAWAAMTGVAQEDDDGNKASGIGSKEAAQDVAKRRAKESVPAGSENEPLTLVPWKEGQLAITGNSLALLRAEMSAEDREKIHLRWSGADKTWVMPESDGNMFESLAQKHKFKVVWK